MDVCVRGCVRGCLCEGLCEGGVSGVSWCGGMLGSAGKLDADQICWFDISMCDSQLV